jgi:hypothetical protein
VGRYKEKVLRSGKGNKSGPVQVTKS